MQAFILRDVRVIWCNSLGDSLSQIYVMNFVEIVIDFYLHITSHVSQTFASCTHYTNYSLLNFVYVIVCDFGLANQVWKFLEFYTKKGLLFENLRIIDWKPYFLGNLGSIQVFLKSIPSHTHAFYSQNIMLWGISA